jgi:site-specific DNA-cytosine methylase
MLASECAPLSSKKFVYVFGSDIEKACSELVATYHECLMWFEDVTDKSFRSAPHVDIFICGFPCQPYSQSGLHGGLCDQHGRGLVILYILRYVAERRPKIFIFENVPGMVQSQPALCLALIEWLENLRDANGQKAYHVLSEDGLNFHFICFRFRFRFRVPVVGSMTGDLASHQSYSQRLQP